MAEINIQKKRRPVWPWVVIIILIILIGWILINDNGLPGKKEVNILPDTTTTNENSDNDSNMNSEVNNFIEYVNDSSNTTDVVKYSREGLTRLSSALGSIEEQNDSSNSKLNQMRQNLDKSINEINDSGSEQSNSKNIKKAFMASAELMESIHNEKNMNNKNQSLGMKSIGKSIKTNQPIEHQLETVKSFFKQAIYELQQMQS